MFERYEVLEPAKHKSASSKVHITIDHTKKKKGQADWRVALKFMKDKSQFEYDGTEHDRIFLALVNQRKVLLIIFIVLTRSRVEVEHLLQLLGVRCRKSFRLKCLLRERRPRT